MKKEVQWGYSTGDKTIHKVDPASANEGYMTAEEYARIRAKATGGQVFKRTRTVNVTDWEPEYG